MKTFPGHFLLQLNMIGLQFCDNFFKEKLIASSHQVYVCVLNAKEKSVLADHSWYLPWLNSEYTSQDRQVFSINYFHFLLPCPLEHFLAPITFPVK